MAISKRLRFEILRRDNHTCRYCGATADDTKMAIDHVVPVALGGTNKPSNLVAACRDCNAGKSSVPADAPLIADVAADALRWAKAMDKAAEIDRQSRSDDLKFVLSFGERLQGILDADPDESTYCIPDLSSTSVGGAEGLTRSLTKFRDCGLDLDDLEFAIRKAASNRTLDDQVNWRYFCGICWRMIDDRQQAARALIEADDANG